MKRLFKSINLLHIILLVIVLLILIIIIISNSSESFKNKFNSILDDVNIKLYETFSNNIKFKAPPSFTNIKGNIKFKSSSDEIEVSKKKLSRKDIIKEINNKIPKLKSISNIKIKNENLLSFPKYFSAWDKWPGCLPPALYQGNCGSCWAFACATALSSRFYLESCGISGCYNYPQINQKALEGTLSNISINYKFNKVYFQLLDELIDSDNNKEITEEEWLNIIKKAHNIILSKNSNSKDRFKMLQLLVYILNYQSFGSIRFNSKNPNLSELLIRGKKTFKLWKNENNKIILKDWQDRLLNKPIPLSPEKLISCCYPDCYKGNPINSKNKNRSKLILENNPQCSGGTLINAWKLLRDVGTTSSLCIGYNLDHWEQGEPTKNCKELTGSNYSYCSGYTLTLEDWNPKYNNITQESEKLDLEPKSVLEKLNLTNKIQLPWTSPQLFTFKAKNAYKVKNSITAIQREIIERGPVTTGYYIYDDFQYEFGTKGMGGQLHNPNKDPILGPFKESLIYMHIDDGTEPIGAHAITITGWGEYKGIPYWICLNTWGIEWGTSGYTRYDDRTGLPYDRNGGGYFWMVRGINNCEFEDNVVAGQPNLKSISYKNTISDYGWGLPFPDLNDIKLIEPFENNEINVGDISIKVNRPLEGSSQYVEMTSKNNWEVKHMEEPSPYTLFWKDERPRFLIGNIKQHLLNDINHQETLVDKNTLDNLIKIMKIYKHPIVIINNEQLQIYDIIIKNIEEFNNIKKIKEPPLLDLQSFKTIKKPKNDNLFKIKLFRGINDNLEYHPLDSELIIFPYKQLSIDKLNFLPKANSAFETSNTNEIELTLNKFYSPTFPADL